MPFNFNLQECIDCGVNDEPLYRIAEGLYCEKCVCETSYDLDDFDFDFMPSKKMRVGK